MRLRTLLQALAAVIAVAGPAAADPIVAKDALGQEYQLNDDGTYARIVRTDDGKIFLLSPTGGTWYGQDDAKLLSDRFGVEFDKAIAAGKGPSVDKDKIPAYRECIIAAFNRYPIEARRILMSGGEGAIDIQKNYEALQKAMPTVADSLNRDDRKCRND